MDSFLMALAGVFCLCAAALDWDFPWISVVVLLGYGLLFYGLAMFSLRKTN